MASSRFECGGYYKNYDMTKELHIGSGVVKVHDLFQPLPDFIKDVDVILSDPPYNQSALSSFYTKADIKEKQRFDDFFNRFFEIVDDLKPRILILEIGVAQEQMYMEALTPRYKHIISKEALYYRREKCLFIIASNEVIPDVLQSIPDGIDEEKIIDMICRDLDYSSIYDPCMGTGLVGWYSNKYGKKFYGTELNKKRLGLLVESIVNGKKVM